MTPGAVGRVGVLLPAAKNKPRHPPATSCHLGFGLGGFSRCILFFYEYLAGALRAPENSRIYKSGIKRATAACGRAFSNALEETNGAKHPLRSKLKILRAGVCDSHERAEKKEREVDAALSRPIWCSRGFLNRRPGGRPSSDCSRRRVGLANANRESPSITRH